MAGSMGKDIQSKISRCFPDEANKGTFAVKSSGRLNNGCGKNKCFIRSLIFLNFKTYPYATLPGYFKFFHPGAIISFFLLYRQFPVKKVFGSYKVRAT